MNVPIFVGFLAFALWVAGGITGSLHLMAAGAALQVAWFFLALASHKPDPRYDTNSQ